METAVDLFFSDQQLYLRPDYRCLDPTSHRKPEKWATYHMGDRDYDGSNPGFRVAHDETSLSLVPRVKYNKNFHNWIDPQVLRKFTSGKKAKTAWIKLFGYGVKWQPSSSSEECKESCKVLVSFSIIPCFRTHLNFIFLKVPPAMRANF